MGARPSVMSPGEAGAPRAADRTLTLRQLRVFRAIARRLSFTRAGEEMQMTQPSVSRALIELEAQLGVRLLERTTREVVLTDAGRSLAARLDHVLDDLDAALEDIAGLGRIDCGTVRVATTATLSANVMPACIAACAASAPEIRFVLLDRAQDDVLQAVRQGEVDFALAIDPPSPQDLHCETVLRDQLVAVMPRGHRLAAHGSIDWTALDGAPLVLLDRAFESRRLIDRTLAQHDLQFDLRQEVGHPTAVFSLVEAGVGISVMPALSLPPAGLPTLVTRPLAPPVLRAVMMIRRRNRALSPTAERVWSLVRQAVASRADQAAAGQ